MKHRNRRAVKTELPIYTPFTLQPDPLSSHTLPGINLTTLTERQKTWAARIDGVALHENGPAVIVANLVEMAEKQISGRRRLSKQAITNQLHRSGASRLMYVVQAGLAGLRYLATKGHFGATFLRHRLLDEEVTMLNIDAQQNPLFYRESAQAHPTWPINYSPNSSLMTDIDKLQTRLGVGDLYGLAITRKGQRRKKTVSFEALSNNVARRVFQTLQENRWKWNVPDLQSGLNSDSTFHPWIKKCKTLRDFSASTFNEWEKVGWAMILDTYHQHPENDLAMRKLGMYRASRASKGSKSENTHIRGGIRDTLKAAFKRLAR